METCAECHRRILDEETPHAFGGQTLCDACAAAKRLGVDAERMRRSGGQGASSWQSPFSEASVAMSAGISIVVIGLLLGAAAPSHNAAIAAGIAGIGMFIFCCGLMVKLIAAGVREGLDAHRRKKRP